jgi:FixJ family two-component response regulator
MTQSDPMVFVVDDDDSVRKSLRRLIRSAGYEVKAFASVQEFLHHGVPARPGCIVLDIGMPELSGMDLREILAEARVTTPIVLTGQGEIPPSVRSLTAGADEFLRKPFEDRELLAAIGRALDRDVAARAEHAAIADLQARVESLTPRERDVFTWVITGLSNGQIAAELGTSEKAVKTHCSRLMKKMEADSVGELIRLAEKVGILPPGAS